MTYVTLIANFIPEIRNLTMASWVQMLVLIRQPLSRTY